MTQDAMTLIATLIVVGGICVMMWAACWAASNADRISDEIYHLIQQEEEEQKEVQEDEEVK